MKSKNFNRIFTIGDDEIDMGLIGFANKSSCPEDAVEKVKSIVDYICKRKGGAGCVREFIELILGGFFE